MIILLFFKGCDRNKHINGILNYKNVNANTTNIPGWKISCNHGSWDSQIIEHIVGPDFSPKFKSIETSGLH